MNTGTWSNDSWTIKWVDSDHIQIEGPLSFQKCKMAGGDFEYILSALCSVMPPDKDGFGCYVEGDDADPTCVLDSGDYEDCIYGHRGMTKDECKYWKPM